MRTATKRAFSPRTASPSNEQERYESSSINPLRHSTSSSLTSSSIAQSVGANFRVTVGLPVGAVVNCADNTGAKNIYVISVKGIRGRLNRLPAAGVGDMVMCSVKKGKPELRKQGITKQIHYP